MPSHVRCVLHDSQNGFGCYSNSQITQLLKHREGSCRDGPVREGLATQHDDLCLDSKNPSKTEHGGMGL